MRRAYGALGHPERHTVGDVGVAAITAAVTLSVATGWSWPTLMAIAGVAASHRRQGVVVAVAIVLVWAGAWRADASWAGLQPRALGPFDGWALVVDDPQTYPSSTRVIVDIEGERFETWHRGRAVQIRVGTWRAGEWIRVSGDRRALDAERQRRVAWQHVIGELRMQWASDVAAGRPVDRASNRVRAAIERGADTLPGADGSLFRGLVVGDDRDQPRAMIERFRASGLSHLTAVSGQNVSFVLAAAGPVLVRLRPGWRWAVTVGLVAWFVSLTRFEPSIVRAGVMAGLSATGFVLGRERSPFRLLCWAVTGLLLVDPLLAWSVGFWLSVGATAGVTTAGPWLGARLGGGSVAMGVGVTLGAQAGVVIPAVLVFGRLPLVSVPANLLAVPVAGFVMLYGLPAGLVAGFVPASAPVVMLPCRLGVRWVDWVAVLGERVEPGGAITWVGWAVVVAAIAAVAAMNRGGHGRASADR
jgi:competence protein ComEC